MSFNDPTTTVDGADIEGEISGVTITGSLVRTAADPNPRVEVGDLAGLDPLSIRYYTADPAETFHGRLSASKIGNLFRLRLGGFDTAAVAGPTFDALTDPVTGESVLEGEADRVTLRGFDVVELGDGINNVEVVDGVAKIQGETWHPLVLAGSWVQDTVNTPAAVGDAAPSYRKDATGLVHVRGYIRAGAAITIATLPVGYRPTLTYETPLLRSNTGAANWSTVRVQTNGVIDVLTNSAAAFTRLSLNFSFPTL